MPRSHPEPRWAPDTSPAERLLHSHLREALPEDVVILNQVMLTVARPGRPEEVEADLVIVSPTHGVVIVEVKGGEVSYDAGHRLWRQNGRTADRDPVQQVKRARSILRDHLAESRFPVAAMPFRWVLATPDCALDPPGEPILAAPHLWDSRSLADLPAALDRALGMRTGGEEPLDRHRVDGVRRALSGRSVEGRASVVGPVRLLERRILARSQSHRDACKRFLATRRAVIRGAAGTGKTFLAVEVAADFAAQGQRVLLTCWTRLLAEDLRAQLGTRLGAFDSPVADQVTDDPLGRVVVDDLGGLAGGASPPEGTSAREWYQEHLPDRLTSERTGGPFDVIVLDEAQDPGELWLHAINGILTDEGRWYAFADRQQDLFGTRSPLPDFLEVSGELTENFRNSRQIATFAGTFGAVEIDCVAGDGPPVAFRRVAADRIVGRTEEIARKLVRDEGFGEDEVAAIWLYHNPWRENRDGLLAQHRDGGMVTTNSASFKGMERPVVVLGLDVGQDRTKEEHRRSVYAAATRARSHLVVVGDPAQLRDVGLYDLAAMFRRADEG